MQRVLLRWGEGGQGSWGRAIEVCHLLRSTVPHARNAFYAYEECPHMSGVRLLYSLTPRGTIPFVASMSIVSLCDFSH